ncbi:TPA: hypothetical protein O1880_002622 [Staphylococcus aureus]|uniref:hypothetical protein n=1 Tax=Staphylococcus aureus TaxID=1280 RepID=UPI000DAA810A|nr:hypothetical protein [Staphylococcus aureus]PZK24825.1 hypothetical protein C7Q70_14210 [Staphylococcus aureus]HCY8173565.1 hypothetical protein [Staphylococcus aureus]
MNNLKLVSSRDEENKLDKSIIFIDGKTHSFVLETCDIKEYIEVAISDLLMFLLEDVDEEALIGGGTQGNEYMISYSDDEFENILFNSKKLNKLKSFRSLKMYMMSEHYKTENINDIRKFLKFYNAVADEAEKNGHSIFHKNLYIKIVEIPKELKLVLKSREEIEDLRRNR